MRISTGTRKGLAISLPKRFPTRPTLSKVKEALFNILNTRVEGCVFLDLYAGTGSIGLEAHSRGASQVIFVERNWKTSLVLHRNVKRYCKTTPRDQWSAFHIHTLDVDAYLRNPQHWTTVDIIFADPPYDTAITHTHLNRITHGSWLRPDGLLVVEHRFKQHMDDICEHFLKINTYRYGDSALSIYTPIPTTSTVQPDEAL